MYTNDFYSPEVQGPYEKISIGRLELENGGVIEDCELAVVTLGELNRKRNNAILIPTWFTGTHKTWVDHYIGPDHTLNPEKYFIIIVNQIGNGLSTSPHNTTDPTIAGPNFPFVSIGDDVTAQERLLRDHFGVTELFAIVGAAMGGLQGYEWAVRHPKRVHRLASIAGAPTNSQHDHLFTEVLIEQITSDPGFNGGEYSTNADVAEGLRRHSHIWSVLGLSTEWWRWENWRSLGVESRDEAITQYLEPAFTVLDPNSVVVMARKWQAGDVTRHTGGDLAAALGRITARVFVLPVDFDMFVTPVECAGEAHLIPRGQLHVLRDEAGHFAIYNLSDKYMEQIDRNLRELFAS